jgi:hypothetical protein
VVHNPQVIAWVESPLQLIGAAEWAAAHRTTVPVAGRLTPQMSETADELLARGARFGECAPYLGIPWMLLARHRHWLVGDGFSGQFRLAASILRPRRITFLDDGANTLALADSLLGRRPYERPGNTERGLTRGLVPFVLEHVLGRSLAGAVEIFTAFDLGDSRLAGLAELRMSVERHTFAWTRQTARPTLTPSTARVLLGSALPIDGRMPLPEYLDWVRYEASIAPLTYLPHRRETFEQLEAVAAIPGVEVSAHHLPAELVLAGAPEPLEIVTLPSSTLTTLPLVLDGTRSTIRRRSSTSEPTGGNVSA